MNRHRRFVTDNAHLYDELLALQGGGCAICGRPAKTRRLDLDHDHRTMTVRGLLCHRCNRGLPSWVTVDWLLDAMQYLAAPPAAKLAGSSDPEAAQATNGTGR